jgi:hypothetical protein
MAVASLANGHSNLSGQQILAVKASTGYTLTTEEK